MRRKERITNLVRDNTQRLTQLAMMLKEQNQYTDSLDNRQKKVVCKTLEDLSCMERLETAFSSLVFCFPSVKYCSIDKL